MKIPQFKNAKKQAAGETVFGKKRQSYLSYDRNQSRNTQRSMKVESHKTAAKVPKTLADEVVEAIIGEDRLQIRTKIDLLLLQRYASKSRDKYARDLQKVLQALKI